jgi:CRP-like cAMP-binding protein
MQGPAATAASYSTIRLMPGDVLIEQGEPGGSLYVLEEGELGVSRDGIAIATIDKPYSVVGEMSVVLGTPTSATVRASKPSIIRVFADARATMAHDADFAFRIAYLIASRLDATSALLVEHTRQHGSHPQGDILSRILAALHLPPADAPGYAAVVRHDMFGGSDAARE